MQNRRKIVILKGWAWFFKKPTFFQLIYVEVISLWRGLKNWAFVHVQLRIYSKC